MTWRARALALVLALVLVGLSQPVAAQVVRGKVVGVYVSMRHFSFSEPYNIPMGVFLQRQDSLGLASENLRLGATIKLGTFLADLTRQMGADSVYFINAEPNLSQLFIRNTTAAGVNLAAMAGRLPPGTDLILSLDSLALGTVQRTSLYVISNEMYSERRQARVAQVTLRVHHLQPNRRTESIRLRYDEDQPPPGTAYLAARPGADPMTVWLTRIWNTLIFRASQSPQ